MEIAILSDSFPIFIASRQNLFTETEMSYARTYAPKTKQLICCREKIDE